MSNDLRNRVLHSVAAVPAPTRKHQRARTVAVFLAFGVMIALAATLGQRGLRSTPYMTLALAAHALAIAVSTWWVIAPGGALGRARPLVRASATAALVILVLGALAAAATSASTWTLPARPLPMHVPCFSMDLVLGAMFFGVAAVGLRPFDPVAPRATAGALGVLALSWAALAMTLRCTQGDPLHVLATHVAPGLALVLVGIGFGARWFGVRALR